VTTTPDSGRFSPPSGFTLVEVVVVLLIMSIIAGVTVPALLNEGRPDDDLTAATRRIETLFRLARDSAIRGGAPVTVLRESATHVVWLLPELRPGMTPTDSSALLAPESDDGVGILGAGTPLELPVSVDLELGQTRGRFTFMPTGATMGDSLVLRHAGTELVVTLDPWTADVVVR
jgi:prepilin-type N-terminal cleavage/methylation domain-containing protein